MNQLRYRFIDVEGGDAAGIPAEVSMNLCVSSSVDKIEVMVEELDIRSYIRHYQRTYCKT